MRTFHPFILRLAVVGMIVAIGASVSGQTPSPTSPSSISVSIVLDKNRVPKGQSPWVILTVKNSTDRELALHEQAIRLHVEGPRGEPPTTLVQRMKTGKLDPGDKLLRADEYVVWTISPGESSSHKYKLSLFYDLSAAGQYTVYVEVIDPVSERLLRTSALPFEVETSKQ